MIRTLKIENLKLSLDNPRLTDSQNETEELEKMVNDQGKKLIKLASDITEFGLSPLDAIAVYPSVEDGKYIVAEGNRRVTALKLLINPELAKNINGGIYQSFKKLVIGKKLILEVQCFIFKSEIDRNLIHWIEIKHQGENEGKGTASWSAIQKARFDKKNQGESLLLDFWAELEELHILTADEIYEITKTNWERILRDYGLNFLGLKKQKNSYIIPIDDIIEFTSKIKEIHKHLHNQTVAIVYDQERIEKFFDMISINLYNQPILKDTQLSISDFPKIDNTNSQPKGVSTFFKDPFSANKITPMVPLINNNANDLLNKKIQEEKQKKFNSKDLFNNCSTVIPNNYSIRSDNPRINKIILELKTLKVDLYPNSCGTLLRLLFELSAKLFLEKQDYEDHTKDDFQPSLNKVSKILREQGFINNFEHAAINKEVDLIRLLFDGYMHNTDSYPSSESIKSVFKAHCKFIKQCLEK